MDNKKLMGKENNLTKSMGIKDYFMLGFGSMVGVGWAVSLNSWFTTGGGVLAAILGFAIVVIIMVPIALTYAEMCPAMPVAGGSVAFTYRAFGTLPAFIAGWFVVLAYINILPWESIYINNILGLLIPGLKAGSPLYTLGGVGIFPMAVGIGIIVSLAVIIINWRGAQIAVKFQTVCTMFVLIAGVCVLVFGFMKANPSNLFPTFSDVGGRGLTGMGGGLLAVLAMAPFFLAGFDTIPQGAEEASGKADHKKMGKIIVISILAAGAFYCLIMLASGMAMKWTTFAGLDSPAVSIMFQELYPGILGNVLYWVTMVGALAGLFTTWNGFFIAGSRLILGMARARLLPKFFSKVHPKYGTPVGGNVVCAVATVAGPFIGMGLIEPLTIIGSSAFVVGWFFTSISCLKLRKSAPEMHRPFKMPGGVATAMVAAFVAIALFLLTIIPTSPGFMGSVGIYYLIGWIVLGAIFYLASAKYRNAVPESERMATLFKGMENEEIPAVPETEHEREEEEGHLAANGPAVPLSMPNLTAAPDK